MEIPCDFCVLVCYSTPLCFPPPHGGALPAPTWLPIHSVHFLSLLPFWSIENMVEVSKMGQTYRIQIIFKNNNKNKTQFELDFSKP